MFGFEKLLNFFAPFIWRALALSGHLEWMSLGESTVSVFKLNFSYLLLFVFSMRKFVRSGIRSILKFFCSWSAERRWGCCRKPSSWIGRRSYLFRIVQKAGSMHTIVEWLVYWLFQFLRFVCRNLFSSTHPEIPWFIASTFCIPEVRANWQKPWIPWVFQQSYSNRYITQTLEGQCPPSNISQVYR